MSKTSASRLMTSQFKMQVWVAVTLLLLLGSTTAFAPPWLTPQPLLIRHSVRPGPVLPFQYGTKLRVLKTIRKVRSSTNRKMSSATDSEMSDNDSPSGANPFDSASALVVLDILFRRLLQRFSISFPSSLAGCGVLFATLLAAPKGPQLYNLLSPGAALLAKWLPVFFVPSLVTLPLAAGLGTAMEVNDKR